MQPLPINEFIQQSLQDWFFAVQCDLLEWNTLFSSWRLGAKDPGAHGAHATNVSAATMDPFFAMVRFVSTKAFPPVSNNWGYFSNPEVDALVDKARTTLKLGSRRVSGGTAYEWYSKAGAGEELDF